MRRIVALLAVLAAGWLAAPAPAAVPLRPCGGAQCGELRRPLDPERPNGRRIDIAFRLYRAADGAEGPPIVAVEGGPGYPSTGTRAEYRAIFGPLLKTRDLLLVDNRGTGGSALIDCRSVQSFTGRTSGPAFARRAARCAAEIQRRYGDPALFATAYAVNDLAAVIRALGWDAVDLYGDSYGTYFVQDFAARHPGLLHSVTLDSAYPRRGTDPWYASSAATLRSALELVSPGSTARLGALLQRVRATPIRGATKDSDGSPLTVTVNPRALSDLVQDSASDPLILRELDASVRAALAGDDVPLLRLVGQANTWSHTPTEATYFSRGLYLAVACADYPQISGSPPDVFAPFTPFEWMSVSGFTQPYDVCADWPKPHRAPPSLPRRTLPASVPVLIAGGDLDSLTPLSDAPTFAPELAANARIVTLRNTVHVTSQGGTYLVEGMRCARRVIRSFLRGTLDDRCGASIPALHTPGAYPRTLAAAASATLVSGPDPGDTARRAVTVAAEAFGDAVARRLYSYGDRGPGLRGGRFTAAEGKATVTFKLIDARFVADQPVSGRGTWAPSTGTVDATLHVAGVTAHVTWTQAAPLATVTVGDSVLTVPAPVVSEGMDAFLAIVSRREVREYDDRPLPEDAVRRILEAGRLAGSSKNRQQRRFVVLTDRAATAEAIWNPENALGAALLVAIVVFGKGPLSLDAGRAAQNMLLAAHNEGIGSCPNGIQDADAAARVVGLEDGEQVAAILTFGHPARPTDPERRSADEWIERAGRLPFDEVVSER